MGVEDLQRHLRALQFMHRALPAVGDCSTPMQGAIVDGRSERHHPAIPPPDPVLTLKRTPVISERPRALHRLTRGILRSGPPWCMLCTVEYIQRQAVSPATQQPELEPGRALRTRELRRWSANPTRLARRLVREGLLCRAAHGLFYVPVPSRFGPAPPAEEEILRAFLGGSPFIISGPSRWNALGLGSTSMFAATLVYNTKRSDRFLLDGRRYLLRRVLFPENPPPEYFVIDLLQQHNMAGISLADLELGLAATLREGRWDRAVLLKMAERYGTKATLAIVSRCLDAAGETS
jgi:hypothetical protein